MRVQKSVAITVLTCNHSVLEFMPNGHRSSLIKAMLTIATAHLKNLKQCAKNSAKTYTATICVRNAFVDATATSGPACV